MSMLVLGLVGGYWLGQTTHPSVALTMALLALIVFTSWRNGRRITRRTEWTLISAMPDRNGRHWRGGWVKPVAPPDDASRPTGVVVPPKPQGVCCARGHEAEVDPYAFDAAIERVADMLRDEFYDTLEDAAGAGDSFDYTNFSKRLIQAARGTP